jgi:hypothetical protein
MKNNPRPLFLLHETLQLALCIRAGSNLLPSAKPRFVLQMVKRDSSFQRTHLHGSRVHGGDHFNQSLALRVIILGLCLAARSWKPIS